MIEDMEASKKLSPLVTELLMKKKLGFHFFYITSKCPPKIVRLNKKHYFIMKIPTKRELQQIALNCFSDTEFKDFMQLYENCTKGPFSFLVNNTTLPSVNPLKFMKNLFMRKSKQLITK